MGNADLTKVAIASLRSYINLNNCPVKLINQVHDEINTECKEFFATTWEPIMNKLMCEAGEIFIHSIPVVVDTVISDSWYKGK
jgi:DNA polymerase I-like protein with 3'-5' exonuclease and polymerase domains